MSHMEGSTHEDVELEHNFKECIVILARLKAAGLDVITN